MGRRTFLQSGLFAAAAVLLKSSPGFDAFIETAQAASIDLVHDTLNDLRTPGDIEIPLIEIQRIEVVA